MGLIKPTYLLHRSYTGLAEIAYLACKASLTGLNQLTGMQRCGKDQRLEVCETLYRPTVELTPSWSSLPPSSVCDLIDSNRAGHQAEADKQRLV